MTKKGLISYLEEELEKVPDDANIILRGGSDHITYAGGLSVEVVCGKIQAYMPYYCVRVPNHEGDCYCSIKRVDFEPDTEEQLKEFYNLFK